MKDESGRWRHRTWPVGVRGRRRLGDLAARASGVAALGTVARPPGSLDPRWSRAALAFRGYDVANLGRSKELVDHARYGPIVSAVLAEVSAVASEALGRGLDVRERIEQGLPSTLDRFADDVALIVGMELAQLRVLAECFGLESGRVRLAFGYSIGELTVMIAGGVFTLEQLLPIPLGLTEDCASLAVDTTMGVLFTREATLDEEEVGRLCRQISGQGRGLIGPSAFLSPTTALLLGEGDTLDRFERAIPDHFPGRVLLRRNEHRWPPLHSPIVWRKNIPNRTATAMYSLSGGDGPPQFPIVSCVTGQDLTEADGARDLMIAWTDRPQRLWDAVGATLRAGVETVIHVGPAPNLIPATFSRLANNVARHSGKGHMQRIGSGLVAGLSRQAWLAPLLPREASLLRITSVEQIILEDWLLAQPVT